MTEQHTTHPLVAAYLHDLDSLLAGLGPGDRAEVMTGVREHIEEALRGRPQPGTREVQEVLAELGPPESVADEAYAGSSAPGPGPRHQDRPALEQRWVPTVVLVVLALALVVTAFTAGTFSGYGTTGTSFVGPDGGVVEEESAPSFAIPFPVAFVLSLLSSAVLWLPATVLVWISPLWARHERVRLSLLAPAAAASVALLPALGLLLTGTAIGINVGAWVGLIGGVGGALVLLRRDVRAARRRAGA